MPITCQSRPPAKIGCGLQIGEGLGLEGVAASGRTAGILIELLLNPMQMRQNRADFRPVLLLKKAGVFRANSYRLADFTRSLDTLLQGDARRSGGVSAP